MEGEETIWSILEDISIMLERQYFKRYVVCESDCVHRHCDGQCELTSVSIDCCGQCEMYKAKKANKKAPRQGKLAGAARKGQL